MESAPAPVYTPPPEAVQEEWVQPSGIDPQIRLIAIIAGALLLLGALGYLAFGRGDDRDEAVAANDAASAAADAAAVMTGQEAAMWVVADANIRDRATARGSQLLGKIPRGTQLNGVMQIGEDGRSPWFRLADGRGFVGAVNLSQMEPPKLAKILGDQLWYAPGETPIHALPDANSPVLQTLFAGDSTKLAGITENGFAEAKLNKGGVGYIAASEFDFSVPVSNDTSGGDISAFYAMIGQSGSSFDQYNYFGVASDQSIQLTIWPVSPRGEIASITYRNSGNGNSCSSELRLNGRDKTGRFHFAQAEGLEGPRCKMFPDVILSGDGNVLNAWWEQDGRTLMSAKLKS